MTVRFKYCNSLFRSKLKIKMKTTGTLTSLNEDPTPTKPLSMNHINTPQFHKILSPPRIPVRFQFGYILTLQIWRLMKSKLSSKDS